MRGYPDMDRHHYGKTVAEECIEVLDSLEPPSPQARYFESGATRDTDEGKFDYEGFLSPEVLEIFGQYMHENRVQSDGQMRDSDNWQKGIPRTQYMKSMWRHFHEVWKAHRAGYAEPGSGYDSGPMTDALCALMFNVMGYLFEMTQRR